MKHLQTLLEWLFVAGAVVLLMGCTTTTTDCKQIHTEGDAMYFHSTQEVCADTPYSSYDIKQGRCYAS